MKIRNRQVTSLATDSYICAAMAGICFAVPILFPGPMSLLGVPIGLMNVISARRLRERVRGATKS